MSGVTVLHGDCRTYLADMPDSSVDAIVTDPPYELGFMGKAHDATGVTYDVAMWVNCLRVLKPGGHLLAFGAPRTWHRMVSAIELAGFDIRDSITWLYGSGFPKSLDVGKAIDREAGLTGTFGAPKSAAHAGWIERERMRGTEGHEGYQRPWMDDPVAVDRNARQYTPATEAAAQWSGWGTALKPASEPIVVARKPITGTVAANVQRWGAGAINVDACRVAGGDAPAGRVRHGGGIPGNASAYELPDVRPASPAGRWPANVVLTHTATPDGTDGCADGCVPGCPVVELDGQSGVRPGGSFPGASAKSPKFNGDTFNGGKVYDGRIDAPPRAMGDTGGASRFFPTFRYQAKAPSRERPKVDGIAHSTVKPLTLMRWLVRLVTPPGGTVLDPFAGSGTTVEAAILEGFAVIGIEQDATYLPLIAERVRRSTPGDAA